MLLFKTALKNILGAGKRTWLNALVLSFTLVIMVGFYGILDGWIEDSRQQTYRWEVGNGQIWHQEYDKNDIFTLQDAHGQIPAEYQKYLEDGLITPLLFTQGSIYPNGRMKNVIIKGILPGQSVIALPTDSLIHDSDDIRAVIGSRMATSSSLNKGDRVVLRWRDKNGVFDAREIVISDIFVNQVPSSDVGQIWVSIYDLYRMTDIDNSATMFVISDKSSHDIPSVDGWIYKDRMLLIQDIIAMEQAAKMESLVIFIILISISLLAVFDTQTLSIFKRKREIGTYVAMGMTQKGVVRLFTIEGTLYSILGVLLALIWGTPLLWLFEKKGFPIPSAYSDMMTGLGDAIYPAFKPASIIEIIVIVVALSSLISYLPARKIARQNIVLSLKGKTE